MSSNNESHTGPGGSEAINTEIITLTRFLTEEQTKHKEATGDFTYVWSSQSCEFALLTSRAVSSATPCNSRSSQLPTTSAVPH